MEFMKRWNSLELRRQHLIQKLNLMKVYESKDGRLLGKLNISELELEYSRAKDREGDTNEFRATV